MSRNFAWQKHFPFYDALYVVKVRAFSAYFILPAKFIYFQKAGNPDYELITAEYLIT